MQRKRSGFSRAPLLAGNGPLARVTPLAAFVAVLALFIVGVVVGGLIGALLIGLLALGVLVLLAVTWSLLSPPARLIRVIALAALIAVGASLLW